MHSALDLSNTIRHIPVPNLNQSSSPSACLLKQLAHKTIPRLSFIMSLSNSVIDSHLDCFQLGYLYIKNSDAMNLHYVYI